MKKNLIFWLVCKNTRFFFKLNSKSKGFKKTNEEVFFLWIFIWFVSLFSLRIVTVWGKVLSITSPENKDQDAELEKCSTTSQGSELLWKRFRLRLGSRNCKSANAFKWGHIPRLELQSPQVSSTFTYMKWYSWLSNLEAAFGINWGAFICI